MKKAMICVPLTLHSQATMPFYKLEPDTNTGLENRLNTTETGRCDLHLIIFIHACIHTTYMYMHACGVHTYTVYYHTACAQSLSIDECNSQQKHY